jgi:hypothetical protein
MRSENPYYLDGAAAMRNLQNLFRVNVVLCCPQAPLTRHRAGGIDEYTVEIKKDG